MTCHRLAWRHAGGAEIPGHREGGQLKHEINSGNNWSGLYLTDVIWQSHTTHTLLSITTSPPLPASCRERSSGCTLSRDVSHYHSKTDYITHWDNKHRLCCVLGFIKATSKLNLTANAHQVMEEACLQIICNLTAPFRACCNYNSVYFFHPVAKPFTFPFWEENKNIFLLYFLNPDPQNSHPLFGWWTRCIASGLHRNVDPKGITIFPIRDVCNWFGVPEGSLLL